MHGNITVYTIADLACFLVAKFVVLKLRYSCYEKRIAQLWRPGGKYMPADSTLSVAKSGDNHGIATSAYDLPGKAGAYLITTFGMCDVAYHKFW